jgi:hypothetical protein
MGEGLICTVIERSITTELILVGVGQLRVSVNSSYFYIVKVNKTLPPAVVNTLVDLCCRSVLLTYSQLRPNQTLVS